MKGEIQFGAKQSWARQAQGPAQRERGRPDLWTSIHQSARGTGSSLPPGPFTFGGLACPPPPPKVTLEELLSLNTRTA